MLWPITTILTLFCFTYSTKYAVVLCIKSFIILLRLRVSEVIRLVQSKPFTVLAMDRYSLIILLLLILVITLTSAFTLTACNDDSDKNKVDLISYTVALNQYDIELSVGETFNLETKKFNEKGNSEKISKIKYLVEADEVASIDENGVITGLF